MKKRNVISSSILVATIILAVAVFQKDNIYAVLTSSKYSQEQIDQLLKENMKYSDGYSEYLSGISLVELSEQQKQKLRNGELSQQEAIDIMTGNQSTQAEEIKPSNSVVQLETEATIETNKPTQSEQTKKPTQSEQTNQPTQSSIKPTEQSTTQSETVKTTVKSTDNTQVIPSETQPKTAEQIADEKKINELVASVYIMKETYVAKLEEIQKNAIIEYSALPVEKQTSKNQLSILMKCVNQASDLEKQCDAQMDQIVKNLTALLKKTGGEMSIVDEIKYAYANEKNLQKAYYINLYKTKIAK